ncbi:hypothetical protein [Clostridium sporogenes]|uniref:hypothetical protein n=1 Tax=Clostridium sporogenes TaxID=1509 RepID=UPI0007178D18|nr:hypothetical protein [Clostridium sporogenes]KRU40042.1 hypothetical protein VT94_25190 [Clostridium sporogenes]MBY7065143.1 hypothetical protein [Clostridium sporogenes]MBY7071811.1 hypothetical protein [Clostridium sporogenes]MCW6065869.1 hypothetical protein [Clostridium sporogenes]OQP88560.1 hypothetical protein VT93_0202040 [Clostridium sporogenes]
MAQNKEHIANLRLALYNLKEEKQLNFYLVEQELHFERGDIEYFIKAEFRKVSDIFSPYKLCTYLNIPIEDIHSSYFRNFGEIKKYENYMFKLSINNKIEELVNKYDKL